MRKQNGRQAVYAFLALLLCAAALQAIPLFFFRADGDQSLALYLAHLYAVIPLCALLLPFFAGRRGVHPMAACWPVGGLLLLLPVYQSPGVGILCIFLSLLGCIAGQEWQKRKTEQKGKHHGGKRKR